MRAGWKKKSVNKLHWYSYTYNYTSYKISFGWVMSRYSFTHHGFHSKTSSRHNNFKEIRQKTLLPLWNLYQQKKKVILTQKFLRFVFSIQRCTVIKVSIVPSWRCCHFLTSFFIFPFYYCSQETCIETNAIPLFTVLSHSNHFFKDLLLNKLPPVLGSVPAGGREAARQWRHRHLALVSGTTGGLPGDRREQAGKHSRLRSN